MPDTEEGRTALGHISHLAHYRGDVVSNIMGWIRARAPWFEPDAARTFASEFTAREPLPSAERLGRLILLTDAERTELKIKTIRAFDVTKAEMDRRRKEADKQYQQDKRRKAGAKPRSESYLKTEPWVFFDIKRRTWERRGMPIPPPRDANSSAVDRGTVTADETASARARPRREDARRGRSRWSRAAPYHRRKRPSGRLKKKENVRRMLRLKRGPHRDTRNNATSRRRGGANRSGSCRAR